MSIGDAFQGHDLQALITSICVDLVLTTDVYLVYIWFLSHEKAFKF
jgi:hypothetical protein